MAPKARTGTKSAHPKDTPPRSAPGYDEGLRIPLTTLLRQRLNTIVEIDAGDGSPVRRMSVKEAVVEQVINKAVQGDRWFIDFLFTRIEGAPLMNMRIGGEIPQSLAELIQFGLRGNNMASPLPPGERDGAMYYNNIPDDERFLPPEEQAARKAARKAEREGKA